MSAVAAAPTPAASAVHHAPGRHVAVRGTRLWIEEEGAGEPVLLLAGGPASSHVVFHPAFGPLAESHRVIYLDYRGRGRSDPVEDPREHHLRRRRRRRRRPDPRPRSRPGQRLRLLLRGHGGPGRWHSITPSW